VFDDIKLLLIASLLCLAVAVKADEIPAEVEQFTDELKEDIPDEDESALKEADEEDEESALQDREDSDEDAIEEQDNAEVQIQGKLNRSRGVVDVGILERTATKHKNGGVVKDGTMAETAIILRPRNGGTVVADIDIIMEKMVIKHRNDGVAVDDVGTMGRMPKLDYGRACTVFTIPTIDFSIKVTFSLVYDSSHRVLMSSITSCSSIENQKIKY
ncbi:hypothetical protein TrispH2_011906, partial [Trichoplax sp. H2]